MKTARSTILGLSLVLLTACSKEDISEIPDENTFVVAKAGVRQDDYNKGYFWTLYREGGWGNISFPNADQYAGNFQISYGNANNSQLADIVGGKGWRTGSKRTINYNVGSLWGQRDFVGVYGWTQTPLIEYYVCEFGYGIQGSTYINSKTINGKKYDFWRNLRQNKPSILGTKTFWQYIDRYGAAKTGKNGSVNMGAHINNWNQNGGHREQWGNMRNYDYQVFAVEAFNGKSGGINATIW